MILTMQSCSQYIFGGLPEIRKKNCISFALVWLTMAQLALCADTGSGKLDQIEEHQSSTVIETQDIRNQANSGVVLLYHHVSTHTPPSTSISPEDFRAHLEYLRENSFSVLPLPEMMDKIRQQLPLPDRAVAITFDDGYISIYENAFPLLQEFSMPFTLFLSTNPIDNNQPGYLNWDQVRELSAAGVQIANHLVSHPYMLSKEEGENDQAWLARLRQELLDAEATIKRETGQTHRTLAYPYGEYDPAIKAMIEAEGFIGFAQNSGAIGYQSDLLALPRFPLASIYANLETARIKLDSLAFNVQIIEPQSPVTRETAPSVTLRFDEGPYDRDRIACYGNGQPLIMNWLETDTQAVKLTPEITFSSRRWRYICTAPMPDTSRFFWYSVQWINPGS